MDWFLYDKILRHERVNGWKSLTIVIKSSNLDIGKVFVSTAGRE